MKNVDWLRDYRERLLSEWASRPKKLFRGNTPKTKKGAERRFICSKLGGGPCELEGEHCARRHVSAVLKVSRTDRLPDGSIKLKRNDDLVCAGCKAGEARSNLLEITDGGLVVRMKVQHKQPQHTILCVDNGENDGELQQDNRTG